MPMDYSFLNKSESQGKTLQKQLHYVCRKPTQTQVPERKFR